MDLRLWIDRLHDRLEHARSVGSRFDHDSIFRLFLLRWILAQQLPASDCASHPHGNRLQFLLGAALQHSLGFRIITHRFLKIRLGEDEEL